MKLKETIVPSRNALVVLSNAFRLRLCPGWCYEFWSWTKLTCWTCFRLRAVFHRTTALVWFCCNGISIITNISLFRSVPMCNAVTKLRTLSRRVSWMRSTYGLRRTFKAATNWWICRLSSWSHARKWIRSPSVIVLLMPSIKKERNRTLPRWNSRIAKGISSTIRIGLQEWIMRKPQTTTMTPKSNPTTNPMKMKTMRTTRMKMTPKMRMK